MSLIVRKNNKSFTFFNRDNINEYYNKRYEILLLKNSNIIKLDKNLDKSKTIVKLYENILDLENIENLYGLIFGFMLNDYIIMYGREFGGVGISVYTDFCRERDGIFYLDEELYKKIELKNNTLIVSYKDLTINILKKKFNVKIVYDENKYVIVKYVKGKSRKLFLHVNNNILKLNSFFFNF